MVCPPGAELTIALAIPALPFLPLLLEPSDSGSFGLPRAPHGTPISSSGIESAPWHQASSVSWPPFTLSKFREPDNKDGRDWSGEDLQPSSLESATTSCLVTNSKKPPMRPRNAADLLPSPTAAGAVAPSEELTLCASAAASRRGSCSSARTY